MSWSVPQVLLSKSFRCNGCDPLPLVCVTIFLQRHSGGQYCPNLAGGANTDSHKGVYEKGSLEVSDPNPCSQAGLQSWIRLLRALPGQLLYVFMGGELPASLGTWACAESCFGGSIFAQIILWIASVASYAHCLLSWEGSDSILFITTSYKGSSIC